MPLNEDEQLCLEAIKSMFDDDARLGLKHHKNTKYETGKSSLAYLHNNIDQLFHARTINLEQSTMICAAFTKIHSYKYIDDPTFEAALQKEMNAQGVSAHEQSKALEIIEKIINELQKEQKEWSEKDSGFNPDLDEVIDISQPEQPYKFDTHHNGYNKNNVMSKHGEASPSRTPDGSANRYET